MRQHHWQPGLAACLLPVAIALALPILADAVIWFGSAQPERFFKDPEIKLFNVAWAAAPFLVWAFTCLIVRRLAGGYTSAVAVGLVATLGGWAWVAWEGLSTQLGAATAAVPGLGMVMLGLPLMVFALMFVTSVVVQIGPN